MKLQKTYKTRGASLAELAIVLGVVGVILGGIWTAASMVRQSAKVEQSVEAIGQIVEGVRVAYTARPQIGGVMNGINTNGISWVVPNLTAVQAFPSYLLNTNTTTCIGVTRNYAANAWGGGGGSDGCGTLRVCDWTYTIGTVNTNTYKCARASAATTATQYFAIEFTSLDNASCINLATKVQLSSPTVGLADVYVNGCSALNGNTGLLCAPPSIGGIPATVPFATAACGAVKESTVDFIYTLRAPNQGS